MSLLSNYVAAVERHLPARIREDVGDELRSSLADSLDAMEESTGCPLSDAEVADVLRQRGHPLLVAGAYRGDRGLVSPQIFPIYAQVLKAGLAIIAGVILARYVFGSGGDSPQPRDALHLFYRFYWSALALFAWVTALFHFADAWMERTRFLQRWDPMKLRRVDAFAQRRPAPSPVAEIIVLVLLISVLDHGVHLPGRLLRLPGPVVLQVAPAWHAWLLPVTLGLAAVLAAIAMANLVRGHWYRVTLQASAIANLLFGICLAVFILDPGGLSIDLSGAAADAAALASILITAKVLLGVVAVTCLAASLRQLRWLRATATDGGAIPATGDGTP